MSERPRHYVSHRKGSDAEEFFFFEDELAELSPRERQVLQLRAGLTVDRPRTLEQVGRELGIKRERARQIQSRALARCRAQRAAADARATAGRDDQEGDGFGRTFAEDLDDLIREVDERRADEDFQARVDRRMKEDAPVLERLKDGGD